MIKIYVERDEYTGEYRTYDENYQADTDNDGTWSSDSVVGYGATTEESIADYWEKQQND